MTSKDNQVNPSKYKMEHAKRGIALVININKYDPNTFALEERKWSKKDVENLTKTLNYLEFDVELVENLTKSQIEQRLKKIASIQHESFDCFLCVVMSHGSEDNIFTSDSEQMSFEEIMAPIKSCKSLSNKPKMFFFQACRGEKEMESRSNSACSTESRSGAIMSDKAVITSSFSSKNSKSNDDNKNVATKFEHESNLLIFNSTLPKHYSFSKNVADGTIFINSFCKVFNDAYKNLPNNLSLAQMITKINEIVSNEKMQISVPEFRMNKEIYFLPKDVSRFFKTIFIYCIIMSYSKNHISVVLLKSP
jgi:hypothetical protein